MSGPVSPKLVEWAHWMSECMDESIDASLRYYSRLVIYDNQNELLSETEPIES